MIEPFTSVLPDIKVHRHYSPTAPLCKTACRHPEWYRTSVWLSSHSSTLPRHAAPCVCYIPSCVAHRRATLVSRPQLQTERSGEARADDTSSCCHQWKPTQAAAMECVPATPSWRAQARGTEDEKKAGQAPAADRPGASTYSLYWGLCQLCRAVNAEGMRGESPN